MASVPHSYKGKLTHTGSKQISSLRADVPDENDAFIILVAVFFIYIFPDTCVVRVYPVCSYIIIFLNVETHLK